MLQSGDRGDGDGDQNRRHETQTLMTKEEDYAE